MNIEHTGEERLVHYVLQEKPSDYPDKYVLRKWAIVAPGQLQKLGIQMVEADVNVIHQQMQEAGLVWVGRHPDDDPVILRTYM